MVDIAADAREFKLRGPQKLLDLVFSNATKLAAVFVLLILGGVIYTLVSGSWLSIGTFGLRFLYTTVWNPVTGQYGALVSIYGTLITSFIAMLVGVPLSFGIAVFITEVCPARLKRPLSTAIELLAGIPSIIYGIWGLFVFAPLLQSTVEPFLIHSLGHAPLIGRLFGGPPLGIGILTAGLILAIMILPFISSILREVFDTVPPLLKESAYGIGCTTWEVVWHIVVPFTRTGMIGGIMLGLGRAMGETMAVTFVIGNSHRYSTSLLAPGQTISSTLANEFTEATDPLYTSALIEQGLVLCAMSFIVLACAKVLLMRAQTKAGN